jgi:hypothetical protein
MKAHAALEYFRQKVALGDDHDFHIVDHTKERAEREKNDGPSPKTRFQIELDDPSLYRQWNHEKDRIITRCHNKAIALDFMYRSWRDALADGELDRMLADEEGPPV